MSGDECYIMMMMMLMICTDRDMGVGHLCGVIRRSLPLGGYLRFFGLAVKSLLLISTYLGELRSGHSFVSKYLVYFVITPLLASCFPILQSIR